MIDKTRLSEEIDSYFDLRDKTLKDTLERFSKDSDDDRVLLLDGLGFTLEQKDTSARITLGVSNLVAFTEELIARGEAWTNHLDRLPEDLREQVLRDDGGLSLSGAMYGHDRYTVSSNETGEESPLWLSQVIYQNDDPVLEAFYIGHEEGHILHKIKELGVIHSLWTEYIDDLVNPGCLNVKEDALVSLLNTAFDMEKSDDNPAVAEAVAHLGGLFAAFRKYDPQEAVPAISPGTDTDEFRHVIWLLGYHGSYRIGHNDMRRARDAVYNWGETGHLRQHPIFSEAGE